MANPPIPLFDIDSRASAAAGYFVGEGVGVGDAVDL
jgi:hypothetical protein